MIISKQALSKLLLFALAFAALILIILPSLLSILLSVKPAIFLYLIFNLLVVVLGVDSGLLKTLSKPSDDLKISLPKNVVGTKNSSPPVNTSSKAMGEKQQPSQHHTVPADYDMIRCRSPVKLMSRNEVKCSPSLFFVGSDGEAEAESLADVNAGKELLTRTEDFIDKFYKHLKMQREESWKKLQDLRLKAF